MKQIFFSHKNKMLWGICLAWLIIMAFLSMSLPAVAANEDNFSERVGVTDLNIATSGDVAWGWSEESGTIGWAGAAVYNDSSCSYQQKSGSITFTNNATEARTLKFTYSLTLNGGTAPGLEDGATNKSFEKNLSGGESYTVTVTTDNDSTNQLSISMSGFDLCLDEFTVTFAAPEDASVGSYTVNGETITSDKSVSATILTQFEMVATVGNPKYVFAGWYANDQLISNADSMTKSFDKETTVKAKFVLDPLYAIATPGGEKTVDELVTINSRYYHDPSDTLVKSKVSTVQSFGYSSVTADTGVADALFTQYVPSLQWNAGTTSDGTAAVVASASGAATGEYESSSLKRSWAYANMVSNVIQIYAHENCVIRFSFTNTVSGGNDANDAVLYYRDSFSGTEKIAYVMGGTTDTDGTFEYALTAGKYLYIYTNGFSSRNAMKSVTLNYNYNASIYNFTVTENATKYIQTTTVQDNTGIPLPGAKVKVNGTTYSMNADGKPVDASGNVVTLEFAKDTPMQMSVAAIPKNYIFAGWQVNDSDSLVCTPTYEYLLQADTTVDPIFVPKQATYNTDTGKYQYLNTSDAWVDYNGQYIARNPDGTKFYTTIQAGFDDGTNEVVLLGNMTFTGSAAFQIPSGETLVVPCNMKEVFTRNNEYRYAPTSAITSGSLSKYATLTVDCPMNVAGTVLVSGNQYVANGAPAGAYGEMTITGSNTVTLAETAAFYGYGLVTGTGTIYANGNGTSGAQIHELCEVLDIPHPMTMQSLMSSDVMPFNSFYMNTIEAKTVYEPGATLDGHICINYDKLTQAYMRLIGPSNSAFKVTKGTLSKYYDANAKQTTLHVDKGSTLDTSSFELKITVTLGAPVTGEMNSADLFMPLCSGWQIVVDGTMNINHRYKILPGAKIDIRETGVMNITGNGALVFYRLNDYDYRNNNPLNDSGLGFSVAGYPTNMTRYSYFNKTNVGSAKLNVDGELYANGGLYVTEDPISVVTETDSTLAYRNYAHYANGYNFLTGTGMIDMGTRNSKITSINESLVNKRQTSATLEAVSVVSMKGLLYGATRDGLAAPFDPSGSDPKGNGEYVALTGTVYGMEAIGTDVNGNPNQTIYVWTSDPCQAGRHTDKADGNLECDNCGTKLAKLAVMNAFADSTTELVLKFQLHDSLLNSEKTGFADGVSASVAFALPASETRRYTTDFEDGLFVVTQPIASGEMTKPVEVSFKNGEVVVPIVSGTDGTCVNSLSRTVVDYAKALLSLTEADVEDPAVLEKQKTFIRALLTYGSYAQNFFTGQEGYSDLDGLPATSDALDTLVGLEAIPDSYQVVRPETSNNGIQYLNQQAYLGSAIKLRVYFNTIDGYTFTVNFGGRNYAVSASTNAEGECYVDILNIPAAYLNEVYTITATNGSGSYVVKTSVMAFLNSAVTSKPNLTNLAQAMWVYNQAAREFFGLEVEDA